MGAAWGHGLATVADDGVVLDTWFPQLGFGESEPSTLPRGERRTASVA